MDNFIENNQKQRSGVENVVHSILEDRYNASLKTIVELKQEREYLGKHVKSAQEESRELNVKLSVREMLLNDKEADIIDAKLAQNNAQTEADKLSWQLEMAQSNLHENTQEYENELDHAASINEGLRRQIQSMLSSGFGVADPETLHLYQTEIGQLKHHIMQLEEANKELGQEQSVQNELNHSNQACAQLSKYTERVDRKNYNDALAEVKELKRKMGDMQQGRDPRVSDMTRENCCFEGAGGCVDKAGE